MPVMPFASVVAGAGIAMAGAMGTAGIGMVTAGVPPTGAVFTVCATGVGTLTGRPVTVAPDAGDEAVAVVAVVTCELFAVSTG